MSDDEKEIEGGSDGEGGGIDFDNLESEVDTKIDNYFSANNNELLSYENLDDFLKEIGLYDLWNSEEEKDELWQALMKYSANDKVDAEGAKKGLHDLLNKEDDDNNNQEDNDNEIKENKEGNLLTRISRLTKTDGTMNKLVLNKYKQKAYDEYDSLDNQTLIQFKKIFKLLNIDEEGKNIISVQTIEKIVEKNKFIKLDKNEIIKYINFLSCDDKPLEEINTITINNTIYSEIDALLQEKLMDEDLDNYEEDEDDEGEKGEDPLDILDEIQRKIESNKDNSLALKEMKNTLVQENKNFSDTVIKIIQETNEENQNENINIIEEMGVEAKEKIDKFDEYILNMTKEQQSTIKKLHSLKKSIVHFNNEMSTLKEDYKAIYEKYNNNQDIEADEQMERLLDENMTLNQEINSKKDEISQLLNERAEKDNEINSLYLKIEEGQKLENDLKKQITELKIAAAKSKEEYDNLMDNVMSKMEEKEKEEKMERNRIKEMLEKQLKTEGDKDNSENIKALNEIDNMNISLTDKLMKKKQILSQLSHEQLMEYTLKLERLNINIKSDKNKKEQKIKELEEKLNKLNQEITGNKKEIGSKNIEIKRLQKTITDLKKEVKANEIYRPSIAMNTQMRVSRISKLNTIGINALKFKDLKAENEVKNSNDYSKNVSFNIDGKKQFQTSSKLKDKFTNEKKQNNFSPQNIMNTMYGDDKIDEDAEQDDKDNAEETKEKKEFEISKNAEENIEGEKNNNFTPTQNGIEFNVQSDININQEGGEIVVDNINDINLGGNEQGLFDIKEEENANEIEEQKDNTQKNPLNSFFDSKPDSKEINLQITSDKKEENINNINIEGERARETIQVKNNNQNAFGGLEDMIFAEMENNDEEEEEDDINKLQLGRVSEFKTEFKNELQISNKYGMDFDGKKRKKSSHENNIKSSGDIMQGISSKALLEKVANSTENNEEQKNNKLDINSSNQINLQMSNEKKNDFQINNEINDKIEDEPKKEEKKQIFEISNSNNINVENKEDKNIIIKNNQNMPSNKNSIEISSQGSTPMPLSNKSNNNKIIFEHTSNNNIQINERNSQKIKNEKERQQIENNNYDYYSLFHESSVKLKLREKNDNANERNIYSDQIYLLTEKKKLEKRLILLTPSYIYIIEPKEMRFEIIFEKTELEKLAISNLNLSILILVRYKADNIILLTLRRMDLLKFIKEQYIQSKKPIRITYEDTFKIRIKGKIQELSVKDKIFSTLSNLDGAIKIGYLQKMNQLIFKTFNEKLVALTSIGLIVFNDPHKPPERLYPIIGSKITKAIATKYKRQNCFEILTPSGETKVFSAYKERDLNSWIEEFEKVKKDFRDKMRKLDTVNKLEFIDNKTDLFNVKEEDEEDEIIPNNK